MTSLPRHARMVHSAEYADVVELADTYDLGSYVVRHAGSSPVIRTKKERVAKLLSLFWSEERRDLNRLNATVRWTVAADGSTEANLD